MSISRLFETLRSHLPPSLPQTPPILPERLAFPRILPRRQASTQQVESPSLPVIPPPCQLRDIPSIVLGRAPQSDAELELLAIYLRAPATVQTWIRATLEERSHHLTLDNYEAFQGSTLEDLLQEPGNEALRSLYFSLMEANPSQLPEGPPLGKKETAALKEQFISCTLKHLQRNPQVHRIDENLVHKQVFFKGIDQRLRAQIDQLKAGDSLDLTGRAAQQYFEEGKAFPSSGDNPYNVDQHHHVANLGVLYKIQNGRREVLTLRSGRPVGPTTEATVSRLYETCVFACLAQWSCGADGRKGFKEEGQSASGRRLLSFQHDILTHLDTSELKAMTRVIGAPDEWAMLQTLMEAVQHWPFPGIPVLLDDPDHPGQQIEVRIQKPMISQHTASIAVRVPRSRRRYDVAGSLQGRSSRLNWADDQRRFFRLMDTCEAKLQTLGREVGELEDLRNKLKAQLRKFQQRHAIFIHPEHGLVGSTYEELFAREGFWSSTALKQYEEIQQETLHLLHLHLPAEEKPVVEQAWSVFFNTRPFTQKAVHAYDRLACRAHLDRFINLSFLASCKSGKDRTALLPAYLSAHDRYRHEEGVNYEILYRPKKITSDSCHNAFARRNKEALIQFGIPVSTQSAGYNGIKWARKAYERNPVPLRGLPAEDLRGVSRHHRYHGELRRPREFLGKSDPEFAKGFRGRLRRFLEQMGHTHEAILQRKGFPTVGTNAYTHCKDWTGGDLAMLQRIKARQERALKRDCTSFWASRCEQLRFTTGHLLKQRERYEQIQQDPLFRLDFFG